MNSFSLKGCNILITGGLGFIGSNLAHRCLELGANVTIYDSLEPRSGGNIHNIADIINRIEVVYQDICTFSELTKVIVGKDIIFNCAASTSHSFSMREPWVDQEVNGKGVINILEAVKRYNNKARLIQIGTSTQLGALQYSPADEQHPEFPRDIYSANKSVSEKYTLTYANAYDINASVVRLANVYGQRASIHSPEFTFNNYFIGLALQGKNITVYGSGTQKRNITYIDDAVEALIQVAQNNQQKGEVFFAVSDDHLSVRQIAEKTVEYIGSGKLTLIDWPAGKEVVDVGDAIISNEKLKKRIGWKQRFSLENGMHKTKEFFERQLPFYLK